MADLLVLFDSCKYFLKDRSLVPSFVRSMLWTQSLNQNDRHLPIKISSSQLSNCQRRSHTPSSFLGFLGKIVMGIIWLMSESRRNKSICGLKLIMKTVFWEYFCCLFPYSMIYVVGLLQDSFSATVTSWLKIFISFRKAFLAMHCLKNWACLTFTMKLCQISFFWILLP